jgi:16S rRNA (guanine(966)-N(2))-methyltransferase RsmD
VGFEAASRGAKELVLVEYNRDCLLAIDKNIKSLGERACSSVPLETDKAIDMLYRQGRKFDVIFLDPPYYHGLSKKALQHLSGCDILTPHGLIVVQHFKRDELPQACGELNLVKEAFYGDTVLSIYRKGN